MNQDIYAGKRMLKVFSGLSLLVFILSLSLVSKIGRDRKGAPVRSQGESHSIVVMR